MCHLGTAVQSFLRDEGALYEGRARPPQELAKSCARRLGPHPLLCLRKCTASVTLNNKYVQPDSATTGIGQFLCSATWVVSAPCGCRDTDGTNCKATLSGLARKARRGIARQERIVSAAAQGEVSPVSSLLHHLWGGLCSLSLL